MNMINSKEKGFTVLELLVVVAIIGILASIVMVSVGNSQNKAKDNAIKLQLNHALKVAELYYSNNGRYGYSAGSGTIFSCSSGSNGDTLFNVDLLPVYQEIAKNVNGTSSLSLSESRCHYGPTLNQNITQWAIATKGKSNGMFFCIDSTTRTLKTYSSNTSPAATQLVGASGTGVITSSGMTCN